MLTSDVTSDLRQYFSQKPSYSGRDVLEKVLPIITGLQAGPTPKARIVKEIKKYDVLYLNTIGLAHYLLVHKVEDGIVHGIVISSKDKAHSLMEITEDRFLEGSYATSTYLTYDIAHCKGTFSRVYESKREANRIFAALRSFYKNQMKAR